MKSANKLTARQQAFVREYLVDLNATKAAIRAGYSKRTARQQTARLMATPGIVAAIAESQAERFERLELTADMVLREISAIGFSNMLDYIVVGQNGEARVDLSRLTREQAAAIGEITVEEFTERTGEDEDGRSIFENVKRTKFKLANKLGALVDLGKHLKLFNDSLDVNLRVSIAERILDARNRLPR